MRLPLLVSASPSIQKTPFVLLREGTWKIEHNMKDTLFNLTINAELLDNNEEEFSVKSGDVAKIHIVKPGTEKSISADLVKIGD